MSDAMDMGDTNEEADDVYNQILGEIGMNMEDAVGVGKIAGPQKIAQKNVQEEQKDGQLDDLE